MKPYTEPTWLEPYEDDDEPLLPSRFAALAKAASSEKIVDSHWRGDWY